MTDTGSIFQTPRGSVGLRGIGDTCPDSETLSAYLDGRLDAVLQGPIDDHLSRCEDCYFVVRETPGVWAEADVDADAAVAVAPRDLQRPDNVVSIDEAVKRGGETPSRPRQSFITRYVLPMAATLIVGVGSVAVWRQSSSVRSYDDAVRPLVNAVGERRFFEPRLTGGFKYGPTVSSKRSATPGSDSETWGVLAAAGELRERSGGASVQGRASRAAAVLFAGDEDASVAIYLQLVLDEPLSAQWPSNLSAALLVRVANRVGSLDQQAKDGREALHYAEAALALDPGLSEARFNRGLAVKLLGRTDEARKAFGEIAAAGGSWSAAARDQLHDLAQPTGRAR